MNRTSSRDPKSREVTLALGALVASLGASIGVAQAQTAATPVAKASASARSSGGAAAKIDAKQHKEPGTSSTQIKLHAASSTHPKTPETGQQNSAQFKFKAPVASPESATTPGK